jgi:Ni,Fe-hydrogenase maturation factor
VERLAASSEVGDSHRADPAALLGLAARLYGADPCGLLVTVPAQRFQFGEDLSAVSQEGVERAVGEILRLVFQSGVNRRRRRG